MGQRISAGRKSGGSHGSYSRVSREEIQNDPEPPSKPSTSRASKELVFHEDCGNKFDLDYLFKASAEVLGKGTFGTSYKACLENGTVVVVKRLKLEILPVTIPEPEKLMEKISSIRHGNVATLMAYYLGKDEQLLLYDFYHRGSMSSLLHGDKGGVIPMPWEDRLNMAIGAARGLAYIHSQHEGKLVHGNLKPSNIFLGSQGYGIVSEVVFTFMADLLQQQPPKTKYHSPESVWNRPTQESDVYSFGVLLLELLVLKFEPAPSDGEVTDFAQWGECVSRDVESGEVFDGPLREPASTKELQEAFRIGIECVREFPEERPKMSDVLKRLEGIRRQRIAK